MKLLDAWKNTRFDQPPFVLDDDLHVLTSSPRANDLNIVGETCEDVKAHLEDDSIHFSLLPQPFNGDLLNAEVYVLTLNPGFACSDYDSNYRNPRHRQALLNNIRQSQPSDVLPFLFLDPKFCDHGGYGYWFERTGLRKTIEEIHLCKNGITFEEVRNLLGHKMAVIEIFPYQSAKASGLGGLIDKLHSSKLALEFVRCHVLEKVKCDEALAIAVRQVRRWDHALGNRVDGVVRYTRGEARRASLSPNTRGGKAIIEWFCLSRP